MNDDINYKNNPLHGISLKNMLVELVDHYGFEILFAYLYINCFKTNPSIESSVKFLKKTDWAREKVEAFYLYEFKNLPRASDDQYLLPPRDRIIPNDQQAGAPKALNLEDAQRLRDKRERKAAERGRGGDHRMGRSQRDSRSDKNDRADNGRNRNGSSSRSNWPSSPQRSSSDSADTAFDPWAQAKIKNKERRDS
ncbi:VF530 family protein [Simiduia curdlanivorans]|uniref:VF530 family protein n=1 Tax=Simiduia curdlanivorans TaxID=1492769 RepID=A0ABV8V7X1_9GAMM|nr:VF530 family protein [Simiduia curdlanivorans]MDN3640640.1 VF530 family protein [Simiduia curdlanivorans]